MSNSPTRNRLATSMPTPSKPRGTGTLSEGLDRIGPDAWAQTQEPETLMSLYVRNWIELAMKTRGVTQTELAKRLGVTPANINTMLRRRQNLTLDTVAKIFRQLDFFPLINLMQWDPPSDKALRKRKKHADASDVMKDKTKSRMVTYFELMRVEQHAQSFAQKKMDTDSVNCRIPPHRSRRDIPPAGASHD